MTLSAGTRLGPFEVTSPLGAGGMGEVYRARDTRLDRPVAIKVLPPGYALDAERMKRFEREARSASALNHPNIVTIYEIGATDSVSYIAMELVDGQTLREALDSGALPAEMAVEIAAQVASGLGAAHDAGIVHRDLKPENIMLRTDSFVKILDFGLAKLTRPEADRDMTSAATASAGTAEGVVMGTVNYMSPEQVKGLPVDHRSDIFSFGIVLYELLSGKKGFQRDSAAETIAAILKEEPPPLPDGVPLALRRIVGGCLQKLPERRFSSAHDLALALRAGSSPNAEASTLPLASTEEGEGARRRRFVERALAGLGLVAVAAGLTWFALHDRAGHALPSTKLLAVLPAGDFTGRSDGRQLCDGFSVSLRSKLQRVSGVSIMLPAAARLEMDTVKVARDTGANLILAPSARKSGDEIQLSYSLALATSSVQIDAGEITGPEREWFRLENELVAKISRSLELALTGRGSPRREELVPGPSQRDYVVALGCLERVDDPERLRDAIGILERIPSGNESALVQAALARAYLSSFDLSKDAALAERARGAAERAARLDPDLPEAQIAVARNLRATGKPAEAVPILRGVLEKNPGNVEAVALLGSVLRGAGDLAGAEATAKHLVDMRPTWWSSHKDLAGFFFGQSRYAEAAKEYQRAIELNPGVYGLYYSLGAVQIRQGRYDEAIEQLKKSIAIKPNALAWSNLGACQYLVGTFSDASSSFEKAIALSPSDYRFHVYLGDSLTWTPNQSVKAQRAYETAIPLAEAVLRVNPRDAQAMNLLAVCFARTSRRVEAARLVQTALSLAPDDADVLERAAVVNLILGRRDESFHLLSRAVERGYGTAELLRDPEFSTIRDDPRFRRLLSAHDATEKPK